jgi:hypothetical protein
MSPPPAKNPSYPPHTPLFEMLKDQWSRQLGISQVISECEANQFKIDWHSVHQIFALLDARMEKDLTPKVDDHELRDLRDLRDLLALIHGDGGHYTEKYGVRKSISDAHRRVEQMLTTIASQSQPRIEVRVHPASLEHDAALYINGEHVLTSGRSENIEKIAQAMRNALKKHGIPPGAE